MQIKTIQVNQLSDKQKDTMFCLMEKYYDNLDKQIFLDDLSEKNNIFLLLNNQQDIVGFTSVKLYKKNINNQNIVGVFSGDTVIDKKYRGGFELPYAWLSYSLGLNKNYDLVFWFMLSKGYKTYRLMPRFFKDFYPHYQKSTPANIKKIINYFAYDLFGDDYNDQTNIYKPKQNYNVKPGRKEITEKLLKNPHINFFAKKNKYFWRGEELVAYCEISKRNMNFVAKLFLRFGNRKFFKKIYFKKHR